MCVNISSTKRIFSNQSHYFPDIPCMHVCISQHYLNLFLPWHRCQAIHSCSRSHINTTIKIANAPATNKWKSLLLLLVQYTARTTTISVTSQATQQNKYYSSCMSQFETWQWLHTFLLSKTSTAALQLNQTSYSTDTRDSTPQSQVARA